VIGSELVTAFQWNTVPCESETRPPDSVLVAFFRAAGTLNRSGCRKNWEPHLPRRMSPDPGSGAILFEILPFSESYALNTNPISEIKEPERRSAFR
jgi:hypothetical protein